MKSNNTRATRFVLAAALALVSIGCGSEFDSEPAATLDEAVLTSPKAVGAGWTPSDTMQVYVAGGGLVGTLGGNVESRWKPDPNDADGPWTAWSDFGITRAPVSIKSTRLPSKAQFVSAVSDDSVSSELAYRTQSATTGSWGTWKTMSLPSNTHFLGTAVSLDPSDNLDLFVAGGAGVFFRSKSNSTNTWSSGWTRLTSDSSVSVAADRMSGGTEQVFWVSTDGSVWTRWRSGSTWADKIIFSDANTKPLRRIAIGFNSIGSLVVYGVRTNGQVIVRSKVGGDQSNWTSWTLMNSDGLSGVTIQDIAASIGNTTQREHLFGITSGGKPVLRYWNRGAWSPWESFAN